ncbi:MAG: DUF1588 domain-containing protein [Polyangiaceae bacterium]
MKRICASLLLLALSSCAEHGLAPEAAPPAPSELLPAGLRRLSRAEYDQALSALLGEPVRVSDALPPDLRQSGFTRNAEQIVDPWLASLLHEQASALAERWVSTHLPNLCDDACVRSTALGLATRAFNRAPEAAELDRYVALVEAEAPDTKAGLGALLTALLESPKLIYVSELGASSDAAPRRLKAYELASSLAWAISGMPPDSELRERAASLYDATVREAEARRLLTHSDARFHYRRFVSEWLGLDGLESRVKDARLFPDFLDLRPLLQADSDAFIDRAMIANQGSLATLLSGGLENVPAPLRALYGLAPDQPGSVAELAALGRVGILQQPSFLAATAHEDNSGPVLRGVTVLRRLLCRELPAPSELGIELTFPAPDPSSTTRERYAAHARDAACAACHRAIDGVGFSFENFDAEGRLRQTEAGKPIDSSGSIRLGGADVALSDSVALSRALSHDAEAEACLARQVFRFASGRRDASAEQAFVDGLAARERGSILELFVAFVKRPHFVWRRQP